jgi:hypothetical protein
MSENSPVTFAHKVFWGEKKLLQYPITGGGGQSSTWALEWDLWVDSEKELGLIHKTSAGGIAVIDAANDLAQVALNADDWDEVIPGNAYYFELWRVDAGNEQVLSFGEFYVR